MNEDNFENLPEYVLVQGLPFMLQGWNNVFYRSQERADGVPIYKLQSYWLYGWIDIASARLLRIGGVWVLRKNGYHWNVDAMENLDKDWEPKAIVHPSPVGQWRQITVTDVSKQHTQIRKWLPFWFF